MLFARSRVPLRLDESAWAARKMLSGAVFNQESPTSQGPNRNPVMKTRLRRHGLQQARPAALFPLRMCFLMIDIASDQRQRKGGLTVYHLLVGGIYFAPGTGLFKGAGRESSVADVGDRYLDRILVHRRI